MCWEYHGKDGGMELSLAEKITKQNNHEVELVLTTILFSYFYTLNTQFLASFSLRNFQQHLGFSFLHEVHHVESDEGILDLIHKQLETITRATIH